MMRWKVPKFGGKGFDRFDWFLMVLAVIFLIIFDYTQNMFQHYGDLYYSTFLFGMPAIYLFWLSFALYQSVFFIAFARAVSSRGRYKYDLIAGFFLFLGAAFLIVGGIGAMYFQTGDPLPFFFNIKQITMYHFFGVLIEIVTLIYFLNTE